MIPVTLQDKSECYLNPDLIERIEKLHNMSVITLMNEKKMIVLEDTEELVSRIVTFKKEVGSRIPIIERNE